MFNTINKLNHLSGNLINFSTFSGIIQISAYLISFALSVVLVRGLGVSSYGIYVYAMALISLLSLFNQLGIPTFIVREASISQTQKNWHYLYAILMRSLQVVALVSVLLLCLSFLILWLFSKQLSIQQMQVFGWLLWLLPLMAFFQIMLSVLRGLGHVIIAQVIKKVISPALLLIVLIFLFVLSPEMRIPKVVVFVQFCIGLIMLFMVCFVLWQRLPKIFFQSTVITYRYKSWLQKTTPFILLSGAGLLNTQIDVLMLGALQSSEQVGIYRIAAQVCVFILLGLRTVNFIIAPKVAELHSNKNHYKLQQLISISTRISATIAISMACVLFIFGQELIILIFGQAFSSAYIPLSILLIGTLVSAVMGPVGLLANMTGHERYALRYLLLTALLNVVLNIVFIPIWGMIGAAIATASSIAMRNILLHQMLKSKIVINSSVFQRIG